MKNQVEDPKESVPKKVGHGCSRVMAESLKKKKLQIKRARKEKLLMQKRQKKLKKSQFIMRKKQKRNPIKEGKKRKRKMQTLVRVRVMIK